MKKILFGTTALAGALALAAPASAGEITLPGALDLRISGVSDFEVEYADGDFDLGTLGRGPSTVDPATGEVVPGAAIDSSRSWFFNQDHEIVFRASGVGDATGINYGANLELELQTGDNADGSGGTNANWDEAWTWIGGSWGEFRFGNEDAVTDNLKITAASIARGTGGVDGAGRVYARATRNVDGGEATKIIYYTPEIAGFQAGVNYAINGDDAGSSRGADNTTSDHIDVGANWQGAFSGVGVGIYGGVSFFNNDSPAIDDSATNFTVGALVDVWGVEVAGAYWDNDSNSGSAIDNAFNVGLSTEFAGVGVGFGYQHESGEGDAGDADTYVLSADTGILPGVALRGDVGYVDLDETDGMNAVLQLRVAF